MASFHPDDVVLVFTKQDVKALIEQNNLAVDPEDACRWICRQFNCEPVWAQMTDILTAEE